MAHGNRKGLKCKHCMISEGEEAVLLELNFLCQFHFVQFTSLDPFVSCEVYNEQTDHYNQSASITIGPQQNLICRSAKVALEGQEKRYGNHY